MVDFAQIQNYMRRNLEKDMESHHVTVSGEDLKDALRQAALELAVPIKKIEYEILDAGSKGILGLHKKPCRILAYPVITLNPDEVSDVDSMGLEEEEEVDLSVDGKVHIRRDPAGIMMQTSPPENGGVKATEQDALDILELKQVVNANMALVSKLVKRADNVAVKIADFDHDPAQDAHMAVDIQEADMKAFITIATPGTKGADPSFDAIISFLNARGITTCRLDDDLTELANNPVYNQPVLIAQGRKAVHGKDAKINYNFQIQTDNIRFQEIDGKVDYKELGKVNNVVGGQVLATLSEPTTGEDGQTVTGKILLSHSGRPLTMEVGSNVRLSDDGHTAIAETNGQVTLLNNKISVEPVYFLNNGVNLKTGNVLFLGTVVVIGPVEDGFSVKASGNIEISGSVGKCELTADGDIVIRQGMNGREEGSLTAGGNIYAKFIQNTNVVASGIVVVSDGIINSNVSTDKKILCKGKRAAIVGGILRASEEINAKTLGSLASVETQLEVGFDPKSKKTLAALLTEEKDLNARLDSFAKDIYMLENQLKLKKKLSEDRANRYNLLKAEKAEITERLSEIAQERSKVHEYMNNLKTNGKISASGVIYPGVKVSIMDASLDVRNEFKKITFVNEDNLIKVTKYEEIDETINMMRVIKQR